MARFSFTLPSFERCERPTSASLRAWRVQPGRLAQGPEEKCGFAGRFPGIVAVMFLSFQIARPSLGRGGPRTGIRKDGRAVKDGANKLWKNSGACALSRACSECRRGIRSPTDP